MTQVRSAAFAEDALGVPDIRNGFDVPRGRHQQRNGAAVRSGGLRRERHDHGAGGRDEFAVTQAEAHLTELAHKYKDKGVRFIGVDVWEGDTKRVKPFVDEMGEKMDYSVALDTVPSGGDPNSGAMARTWMAAAEENGRWHTPRPW